MKSQSDLKVCLITPFPPEEKGVAEYSKELVKSLYSLSSETGARVHAYVISHILDSYDDQSWAPIYPQTESFLLKRSWNSKSLLNQLRLFKDILRMQPDLVHLQYGPCADYGGLLGEPFLILFGLLRLVRIPTVITLHSIWFDEEVRARAYERVKSRFLSSIAAFYFSAFIRRFFALVDKVLVCVMQTNSEVSKKIISAYNVSPEKVVEILHGSPTFGRVPDGNEIRRKLGIHDQKVLLCFGFIRKEKGYEYAIEALSRIIEDDPNVLLIIAGKTNTPDDLEYLGKLKQRVSDLKLGNQVLFDARYLTEEDVIDYFRVSDALLLPYTGRVGPSGPFHIAMSLGVPIIAAFDGKYLTNSIGLASIIPPRDTDALVKAIRGTINMSSKHKNRIKEKPYASKQSFVEIAKQHVSIYLSLRVRDRC
jgi:glycosyltransferase involved in cell wall biosynthesis